MEDSALIGLYKTRSMVEHVVHRLKDEGFSNTDISVLFPHHAEAKEVTLEHFSKAPEGAAVGIGTGAVIGVVLGWLAGIGTLVIPGAGAFIAAGPVMSIMAGATVGSAVGGLAGALIGLGFPEFEAHRYAGRITQGEILVSVHCHDPIMVVHAREILTSTGAQDIHKMNLPRSRNQFATY